MDTQLVPAHPVLTTVHPRRLSVIGDERLARLVSAGNEQAFATLYARHYQRLYRYCRSILHNDSDAQDALQSTFTRAYVALAEGRRDAPLRPWLYRIAHNESISVLRRRRSEVTLAEAHQTPAPSAEELAGERAAFAVLVADLGELSERQRGALVMRELSGLSHAEIAAVFCITVGAAKQTIFEARRSLAEFAEGRAMLCDEVCRTVSDGTGRTLRGRKLRAHLRDCASCATFAASIPARSRDLRAIAPPLSAVAATSLLRRALGAGSSHGSGGTGAGVAAGAAGKAAGIAATAKAVAGLAVVVTAAAGLTGVVRPFAASAPGGDASAPTAGLAAASGIVHGDHRSRLRGTPRTDRSVRTVSLSGAGRRPRERVSKRNAAPRARNSKAPRSRASSATAGSRTPTGRAHLRASHGLGTAGGPSGLHHAGRRSSTHRTSGKLGSPKARHPSATKRRTGASRSVRTHSRAATSGPNTDPSAPSPARARS